MSATDLFAEFPSLKPLSRGGIRGMELVFREIQISELLRAYEKGFVKYDSYYDVWRLKETNNGAHA